MAVGALLGLATACGNGGAASGGCGRPIREPLDPGYLVHVLGDEPGLTYSSDPPTSGPHQPSPAAAGVLDEPLSRPIQVGVLERGGVLVQHRGDLPASDLALLLGLAGQQVVVAPNPDLADPVVVTAWGFKLRCGELDVAAVREFVDQRAGQGPESSDER